MKLSILSWTNKYEIDAHTKIKTAKHCTTYKTSILHTKFNQKNYLNRNMNSDSDITRDSAGIFILINPGNPLL